MVPTRTNHYIQHENLAKKHMLATQRKGRQGSSKQQKKQRKTERKHSVLATKHTQLGALADSWTTPCTSSHITTQEISDLNKAALAQTRMVYLSNHEFSFPNVEKRALSYLSLMVARIWDISALAKKAPKVKPDRRSNSLVMEL